MSKKKFLFFGCVILLIVFLFARNAIQNRKLAKQVDEYQEWFMLFVEEKNTEPEKDVVIARVGDEEITNFDLWFFSAINHIYMVTNGSTSLADFEVNNEAIISGFHDLLLDTIYYEYAMIHDIEVGVEDAFEVQKSIAEVELTSKDPAIQTVSGLKLDYPKWFSRKAKGYYALRMLENEMMETSDLTSEQIVKQAEAILYQAFEEVNVSITEEAPSIVKEAPLIALINS
ncbi:hypothetical protein J2T56_001061 [Natronobacillus azotifigens]|uniref:Uncharacterized protein n=1 Tax=Natronobacillus azotifigens TaxID=472978 RepID=A0A9J6RB09_9BACI|nr:hypothetical protein [Natronobacillus azotifigens]MCZ0702727.1 hypothetical protein [Natronobacillus azotifigens]